MKKQYLYVANESKRDIAAYDTVFIGYPVQAVPIR